MKVNEELIRKLVTMADESNSAITQVVLRDDNDRATGAIVVLDDPNVGTYLDRLNEASDETDRLADAAEGEASTHLGRFALDLLNEAEDRKGFARLAGNIAEDRYSAGSTAARATIYILLHHGYQAAVDFAADLEHHER